MFYFPLKTSLVMQNPYTVSMILYNSSSCCFLSSLLLAYDKEILEISNNIGENLTMGLYNPIL